MSGKLNLLHLHFFPKPIDKENKVTGINVTAATAGGGALFLGCDNGTFYKYDRHLDLHPYSVQDTEFPIRYMKVSNASQTLLIASPKAHTYGIYLLPFSDIDNEKSHDQIQLPIKAKQPADAKLIAVAPSFSYIAIANSLNEVHVLKMTGPEKFKSANVIAIQGTVTGIEVTDTGYVFIATDKAIIQHNIQANKQVQIDDKGANPGFSFMYSADSYGVCRDTGGSSTVTIYGDSSLSTVLDSVPRLIGSAGGYLYAAFPVQTSTGFRIIDMKYNILAYQSAYGLKVQYVLHQWDAIILITDDLHIILLPEIDTKSKIQRLCESERFDLALSIAESKQLGAEEIASIHCQQGDCLFEHHDFDNAIVHYIETIGFTEPSHVIAKFVEPHHAENLVRYLTALQDKKQATKQHTTLLFNCYTKVGARDRLETIVKQFVNSAEPGKEPNFDVATAVDVLKRNGYPDLAEKIAKAYGQNNLYMQLLYDASNYSDMLKHMAELSGEQVKAPLKEYGCEIMDNYEAGRKTLTDFAVRCCTEGIPNKDLTVDQAQKCGAITVLKPNDLATIFVNNNEAYFDFLNQIYEYMKAHPSCEVKFEQTNYNELIEMALRTHPEKVMTLLRELKGKYSNEQVLVYLTTFNHPEGKLFIYEEMKLYTLILQEASPSQCLSICQRFGNDDPTLWNDALNKIASAEDCDPVILEQFLQEASTILPFMVILKVLRAQNKHRFSTIRPIVLSTFKKEQEALRAAEKRLSEAQTKTEANKKVIDQLTTQVFCVKQSRCSQCGEEIDKDSNHFMCGHSFHVRCLGDSVSFCPICRENYERITAEKIKKMQGARDHKNVHEDIEKVPDGFEYLLDQISQSLFASGVDLMSPDNDSDALNDPQQFLQRLTS